MISLLGHPTEGLVFIISAPAGTGKTTLVQMLAHEFPQVMPSISHTTRTPRPGEIHGKHYHFIDEREFLEKMDSGDFIEHVKLYGFYYGTSKGWIQKTQSEGKHVMLVIDTQGAQQIKTQLNAVSIFIRPPSLEALRLRLMTRKTENLEMMEQRLAWAQRELLEAPKYDYQIINDDIAVAYQALRSILIAECHRTLV